MFYIQNFISTFYITFKSLTSQREFSPFGDRIVLIQSECFVYDHYFFRHFGYSHRILSTTSSSPPPPNLNVFAFHLYCGAGCAFFVRHLFDICSVFLDMYWLGSNWVDCLCICISSHYLLLVSIILPSQYFYFLIWIITSFVLLV